MIREEETRENDKRIMQEVTKVGNKLMEEMKKPPSMFNCYQTNYVRDKGTVTYSNCTVDTTEGEINYI